MKAEWSKQTHPSRKSCEPLYAYLQMTINFCCAFSIKSSVLQAKWSHILRGSATSELSATTMAIEIRKNSECAHSTLFGRFLYCHCMTKDVKNDWNGNVLSLKSLRSSLHQWWLSRLWFHQKYPYRGSSYNKTGAYCAFFKSCSLGHVWPIN